MPRLPKDTFDWHPDLVKAASARYAYSHLHNKRDQTAWREALRYLQESRDPIYIQKGGQNKGNIIGIPKSITNDAIRQTLSKIVSGEELVLRPEMEGLSGTSVDIGKIPYYRDRIYRDGGYALLAAMYSATNKFPTLLSESDIKARARPYTDNKIDYDYRTREHGIWKCMDSLRY